MNQFFINYYIGARGDFLIKCLHGDVFDDSLFKTLSIFSKIPTTLDYSIKIHGDINPAITEIQNFSKKNNSWEELFDNVNKHQLIKIKILAESFEERIDVMWLALAKIVLNNTEHVPHLTSEEVPIPTLDILNSNNMYMLDGVNVHLPNAQNMDKKFQHEYDYIIKFEDLFNAEYIRDLYKKINGKDMHYLRFKAIEKNIAMQYRISKSEFYPILKQRYNALAIN